MHFGKRNREKEYTMEMDLGQEQQIIEKTLVEKDLGIIISNDLKWVNQVEKATNSAKSITVLAILTLS